MKTDLNIRFSEIVLESMKLLLNASLVRKKSEASSDVSGGASRTGEDQFVETQRLLDFIGKTQESKSVLMGGVFPQLIAQKSMGRND